MGSYLGHFTTLRYCVLVAMTVSIGIISTIAVQAATEQIDDDFTIEISKDVVYNGEDVTITFTHAHGEVVQSITIRTTDGQDVYSSGNTITLSWEQLVGSREMKDAEVKFGFGAKLRVGSGRQYQFAKAQVFCSGSDRPAGPPPVYSPEVRIDSASMIGDVLDLTYRFTASTELSECTLTGLTWMASTVGGPITSGSGSAEFKFPKTGDYTIKVVAEFEAPDGSYFSDYDEAIYFIGESLPPTAQLYILKADSPASWSGDEARGPAPVIATFTAKWSSDPEGDQLVAYYWYFDGSATPVKTTTPTALHQFNDVGIHTVYLVVEDEFGNQSKMSNPVTVEVQIGSAVLNHKHNPLGPGPDTIDFKIWAPFEKDAKSMIFNWIFGEDLTRIMGDKSSISHTYKKLGRYTVTVECRYDYEDGSDVTVMLSKVIDVQGPIVASFSAKALISVPGVPQPPLTAIPYNTQLKFSGAGSNSPYGKIVLYELDLDGDGKFEHELDVPDIAQNCTVPGTTNACLRVTDDQGNQAEAIMQYTVEPGLMAVLIVTPTGGMPPLEVNCDASDSTNAAGNVHHYIWDISQLGGASTSDEYLNSELVFTFPDPGEYLIQVRACDDLGNESAPAEQWVMVGLLPLPVIDFSKPVFINEGVTFSATGSSPNGEIVCYEWDLYGQGFSSDQGAALTDEGSTVSATYSDLERRTVRLRVTDELDISAITSVTFDVVEQSSSSTSDLYDSLKQHGLIPDY